MDQPGFAIQSVVGIVAVVLVSIFLKLFRDLIAKIIPDGFDLIREEMRIANKGAKKRHKEHIAHMERMQASLDRQEGERRRGSAPRAKTENDKPVRRDPPPKKQQ